MTCAKPTVYDFSKLKAENSALDRVPLPVLLINFRVKINTEVFSEAGIMPEWPIRDTLVWCNLLQMGLPSLTHHILERFNSSRSFIKRCHKNFRFGVSVSVVVFLNVQYLSFMEYLKSFFHENWASNYRVVHPFFIIIRHCRDFIYRMKYCIVENFKIVNKGA